MISINRPILVLFVLAGLIAGASTQTFARDPRAGVGTGAANLSMEKAPSLPGKPKRSGEPAPDKIVEKPTVSPDNEASPPPDLKRIQSRGKLITAVVDFELPPFIMRDAKGNLSGVDIELAQRIAAGLKVEVTFVTASTFNGVVDLVANGSADIGISKLSITLERAKRVRFSTPYLVMRHALLINSLRLTKENDSNTISAVKHFDKELAVVKSSAYVEFSKTSFPDAKLKELDTWDPDVLSAVQKGTVFGALRDEYEVMKVMRTYPSASLLLKPVILTDMFSNIAIAVAWRDSQLLSWIDLFLSMSPHKLNTAMLLGGLEPPQKDSHP